MTSNEYNNQEYSKTAEYITKSSEELVALALEELVALALEDNSDLRPLSVLRNRGNREVFELAKSLCRHKDTKKRELGVLILSQLGSPRTFLSECRTIVSQMLPLETNKFVLQAIISGLAHLDIDNRASLLAPFQTNEDPDIRYSVAFSLGGLSDDLAIEMLLTLSKDEDDDVRNWATFGLGALSDRDSFEIREALIERLSDSYIEVVGEALVGLARRHDERVLEPLIAELCSKDVGLLAVEAAEEMADPRLYPALLKLCEWWDHPWITLEQALKNCSPKIDP